MGELDISNPLVVIVGFFGIFFTSLMIIIRLGFVAVLSPIAGILGGLLLGGVWIKTFAGK